MDVKILSYYPEKAEGAESLEFDHDQEGKRPAWIFLKETQIKPRFLAVQTKDQAEIIYQRFAGNFYYPLDLNLNPLEEERFYKKIALVYDLNVMARNKPFAEFIVGKMSQYGLEKNAKILDLGAGTGIFAQTALKAGYQNLTLLDKSEAMLAVAREKSDLRQVRFLHEDAAKLKTNEQFDGVVSIMMFNLMDDDLARQVLANLHQFVRKSGLLFVVGDQKRVAYEQYFQKKEAGNFKAGESEKYYFIGVKKELFE